MPNADLTAALGAWEASRAAAVRLIFTSYVGTALAAACAGALGARSATAEARTTAEAAATGRGARAVRFMRPILTRPGEERVAPGRSPGEPVATGGPSPTSTPRMRKHVRLLVPGGRIAPW